MPIFYKITSPNGAENYLFGTVHLEDSRAVTLPQEIKEAFEQAERCFFEIDIDSSGTYLKYVYPDRYKQWMEEQKRFFENPAIKKYHETIRALIKRDCLMVVNDQASAVNFDSSGYLLTKDAFYHANPRDKGLELNALDINESQLAALQAGFPVTTDKPIPLTDEQREAINSLIGDTHELEHTTPLALVECGNNIRKLGGLGGDFNPLGFQLALAAKKGEKSIIGLESMDDHYGIFLAFTYLEQVALFNRVLEFSEKIRESVLTAYLKEDLEALERLFRQFDEDQSPEAVKKYYRVVLDERDEQMVNTLRPFLNDSGGLSLSVPCT